MIDKIIDNVDLLEYISQTLEMKKKGKYCFASCPLHVDLTPSFSVTPDNNRFYCFSCGRGGNIINYLMEYEKLTFPQAIEKASALANVDMNNMCQSETVKLNRYMRKVKKKQNIISHPVLPSSEWEKYRKGKVTEWLTEGIRQQEIDLFDVRLDDIGNRIVYPVFDIKGALINIKGRTRFTDYKKIGVKKYINYFKVGTVDYFQGLNITLPYIKDAGEVIVFESVKSVMKLMGNGVKNSVSAEKHTLTVEQIRLLIKMGVDVIFAFDSDVTYKENSLKQNIETLKMFTNVYLINDTKELLGGKNGKNSPIDKGFKIWKELYDNKLKIV